MSLEANLFSLLSIYHITFHEPLSETECQININTNLITLTLSYLFCEFEFRAHFQCGVCTHDLKCVENANQLVST